MKRKKNVNRDCFGFDILADDETLVFFHLEMIRVDRKRNGVALYPLNSKIFFVKQLYYSWLFIE